MANQRRRLIGRVVSDKMQKTVVVEVERRTMHRIYKKVIVMKKRFYAHDEHESAPLGALVKLGGEPAAQQAEALGGRNGARGGRGDTD